MEPGSLVQQRFAVFGLGNSATYPERYQAVGLALGATRLLPIGMGDAAGGVAKQETEFDLWKEQFLDVLTVELGGARPDKDGRAQFTPAFDVEVVTAAAALAEPRKLPKPTVEQRRQALKVLHAPLVAADELYGDQSDVGSCLHVELDTAALQLRYEAGDHLAVWPWSSPAVVSRVGARLGVDLDAMCRVSSTDFPQPCTLRSLLTRHLDLHAAPSLPALRALAEFASGDDAAELRRLGEPGGDVYATDVVAPMLNIVDVLERFPSANVPLAVLLSLAAPMKPRYYSISRWGMEMGGCPPLRSVCWRLTPFVCLCAYGCACVCPGRCACSGAVPRPCIHTVRPRLSLF